MPARFSLESPQEGHVYYLIALQNLTGANHAIQAAHGVPPALDC